MANPREDPGSRLPPIQSAINVCVSGCSGGFRPPSSIGDRRNNPGSRRPQHAQELMSFCIERGRPLM